MAQAKRPPARANGLVARPVRGLAHAKRPSPSRNGGSRLTRWLNDQPAHRTEASSERIRGMARSGRALAELMGLVRITGLTAGTALAELAPRMSPDESNPDRLAVIIPLPRPESGHMDRNSAKPQRLLERVRACLYARHYSKRTVRAYVGWIRRFILFHDKRHPEEMGGAEVGAFLSSLARAGRVSSSTQNQALAALLFLYRRVLIRELEWLGDLVHAKRAKQVPVVLTRQEAHVLLARLKGPELLVCALLYGGGLRLLEALRLRVKDIDLERREITVRRGK